MGTNLPTEKPVDFWSTVDGGYNGYLFRVQENLRTNGIDFGNQEAVEKFLGEEVFQRYQEAGQMAKAEMEKQSPLPAPAS